MSLTAINRPGGNSLSLVELAYCSPFSRNWLALPQHGGVGIAFPVATPRGRSSSSHEGERLRLRM